MSSAPAHAARFVVGIDLGTTNSVLAYVDTHDGETPPVHMLPVPQLVRPGVIEERASLPSFLYLAAAAEFPAGALDLAFPDGKSRGFAVGELARAHGWQVPTRLVSSAKSWLSHAGVDRLAPILPPPVPGAELPPGELARISPVEASTRYLAHLRDAWDARVAKDDPALVLARQDVFLTVPASFDAAARELTARAAAAAGLEVTLLEEPQAAFYSWLAQAGDRWRQQLQVGDRVLVCDVGGGTTDFSLIAVSDQGGSITLERIAVGDHILLGGDNMDLALAVSLRARLEKGGHKLDAWQFRSLSHACRTAKEALLSDERRESHPVTVLGRGRSVIGGSLKAELGRADVESLLLEGFFPHAEAGEGPRDRRRVGLQELGLPFAADPAITRHLAGFLAQHLPGNGAEGGGAPTAVLFNGGVMKGQPLRRRIVETLDSWSPDPDADLTVLGGTDFDLAVAHGAAYYGLVRRGRGVRIRGGTARSYYVAVEAAVPAVPGMEPPLRAICVAPQGMEEGTEAAVTALAGGTAGEGGASEGVATVEEFGLVVGEKAEFRFLASTTRKSDRVGTVVEDAGADEHLAETSPLEVELEPRGAAQRGQLVPVRLRTRVTEVGTLEVWCVARDGEKWKLEFDVRKPSP